MNEPEKYDWRRFEVSKNSGRAERPTHKKLEQGRRNAAIEIISEARELGSELMEAWDDE